ncbi:hypothetical protein [Lysobacter claricitrinus]|uniref:hypothetical protein n=1 Tax=Lysobacter claricitrinus TaxID=3367728 RepID=UPI0037DBB70A
MRMLPALLLIAIATPAWADTTLCTFSSADHDIEFAGDARVSMVYVQMPNGPRSLPSRAYRLVEFDERASRIRFEFRNPGDATLPPSFTLEGAGSDAWIASAGERERGELRCGP